MGWINADVKTNYEHTANNTDTYGTHSPVLSDDWKSAFDTFAGGVNGGGATPDQQSVMDYFKRMMSPNSQVNQAAANTNYGLSNNTDQLNRTYTGYESIAGQAAPQATGATSGGTPLVNAQTGAEAASPYARLYSQELIDPSLAAYDYGTGRALTALDARTAAGGGFANSRSGINYGDLAAQSAVGRGQLESQLKSTALTNSLGFGQSDASRNLQGQTTNAGNTLNNNQFNAGQLQQNSQFNVGAQQQNTAQRLDALGGQARTALSTAGLSEQMLNNIVTANGINTEAAQSLFASGAITRGQLESILSAAAAGNGYSYTQNTDVVGNKVGVQVDTGVGG